MTEPRISVVEPLTPAWERTKRILFRPFDLGRWLVLGFAAWLAGLGGSGGGFQLRLPMRGWGDWGGSASWREGLDGAEQVVRDVWQGVALAGCLVALAVVVVLVVAMVVVGLWASSRGRFVFLDDVLSGRAAIVEPWKRLRRQGNSLFLFRLLFGLVLLVVIGLMVGGTFLAVGGVAGLARHETIGAVVAIPLVLVLVAVVALCLVTGALVGYLLEGFVVPLMHRHGLGVMDGWRRFLGHFRARPWLFLLSGLLLIGLRLGVAMVVVTAGFMTCCLGFLVLMIPYVGTVLLLPVPVFVRSYTVELLAQADPGLLAGP
jgi:hypothetical protein